MWTSKALQNWYVNSLFIYSFFQKDTSLDKWSKWNSTEIKKAVGIQEKLGPWNKF